MTSIFSDKAQGTESGEEPHPAGPKDVAKGRGKHSNSNGSTFTNGAGLELLAQGHLDLLELISSGKGRMEALVHCARWVELALPASVCATSSAGVPSRSTLP